MKSNFRIRKNTQHGYRKLLFVTFFLSIMVVFVTPVSGNSASSYVGASRCGNCHLEKYDSWQRSGHAVILRRAESLENSAIPLPDGYQLEDLSYIIGGFKWKALYLDKKGYLVTGTRGAPGGNQYNIRSGEWVDSQPGEIVPYTCGLCHTTGFSPEGHQGGMPGIRGTWQFEGVQCEVCHGPGKEHSESPLKAAMGFEGGLPCNACHQVEPSEEVPLEGKFLAPYTEGNQLKASPMSHMECVDCHDPHTAAKEGLRSACKECHSDVASAFKGSFKDRLGLHCVDCHMPPSGVVASGDPQRSLGDLRSHLFKIEHHSEFSPSDKTERTTNPGYLSMEYSCKPCHFLFEKIDWARGYGSSIHRLEITTSLKVFRVQRTFTLTGVFFAVVAFLTGLGMIGILKFPWKGTFTVSLHRHAVWITFGVYLSVGTTCLYFHAPLHAPELIFKTGLFAFHPFLGAAALFLYLAKTVAVRHYHAGWRWPGWGLGAALFLFWILQYATVVLN